MPPPAAKLTAAVQAYLSDLRTIRASGGATGERSYYPPLSNRERTILDRPLKPDKVHHFTNTARRITAILLLTAGR